MEMDENWWEVNPRLQNKSILALPFAYGTDTFTEILSVLNVFF